MKLFLLYVVRYWLRFQIGDHIANTTCTIFDDKARKLLKITVLECLELQQGDVDGAPRVIQELYGKVFIFYFKLNEVNLTEGRQGYLVRRTFVPNSKLEEKFINEKNKVVSGGFYIYIIYLFTNILICFLNMKYIKMT
jgi:hypothetical protein